MAAKFLSLLRRNYSNKLGTIADEAGFTLVELSAVVLTISILLLIVLPTFFTLTNQAKIRSCKSTLRIIDSAIKEYRLNKGVYPDSFADIVPEYVKSVPLEPTGGIYTFTAATSAAPAKVECSKGHSY